jgi:DNA-binding GntR family transcriptional regulator
MKVNCIEKVGRVREPKTADILSVLCEQIAGHDLLPGSKLGEMQLVDEFEVSRARIREVFVSLEERGLIERSPHQGAIVKSLDFEEALNLFVVREVLEGLMVRLATEKQPLESWQDLIDLFGEPTEKVLAEEDFDGYLAQLAILRRRFIEGAENAILANQLNLLHDRTRMLITRLVILPGRALQGLAQHQEILAAMRRGNAEEAERLKRANIRDACDCLVKYQKFVF